MGYGCCQSFVWWPDAPEASNDGPTERMWRNWSPPEAGHVPELSNRMCPADASVFTWIHISSYQKATKQYPLKKSRKHQGLLTRSFKCSLEVLDHAVAKNQGFLLITVGGYHVRIHCPDDCCHGPQWSHGKGWQATMVYPWGPPNWQQRWRGSKVIKTWFSQVICAVYFLDTINLNQHHSTKFVWFTFRVWMSRNS